MKVCEMIEKLNQFDSQTEVVISTPAGGEYAIELRELMEANRDKIESSSLVVAIFGSNGGGFGYKPLNYEKRWEILREMERGRKFTGIHGDCRLYSDFGGNQDTCYGTPYHPKLFLKLAEEGYLIRTEGEYGLNSLNYTLSGKPHPANPNPD